MEDAENQPNAQESEGFSVDVLVRENSNELTKLHQLLVGLSITHLKNILPEASQEVSDYWLNPNSDRVGQWLDAYGPYINRNPGPLGALARVLDFELRLRRTARVVGFIHSAPTGNPAEWYDYHFDYFWFAAHALVERLPLVSKEICRNVLPKSVENRKQLERGLELRSQLWDEVIGTFRHSQAHGLSLETVAGLTTQGWFLTTLGDVPVLPLSYLVSNTREGIEPIRRTTRHVLKRVLVTSEEIFRQLDGALQESFGGDHQ